MHQLLISLFILASGLPVYSQAGVCTEDTIKKGHTPLSDDAFAYMPPYGKPVIGKPAIRETNTDRFSDRTNIKSSYLDDHRIVVSPSGDMAYEYGTLAMSYDDKGDGQRHEFKAVMLIVYKAKDNVCEQVALTMQPLAEPQR